ncbi:MAG: type II toxin-antitoxin system PemK/MazF family toxin [Nitrospirae bacterium]|nr:type II toxin-antitoxin system PemK/MazF family toxin [Nitrospirota bacterium]MCL5978662.1 type II toxin-antitoxin system PemK/MazF family toxin [Nitrospirota bacterium]
MTIKQGDIFWLDLGMPRESEPGYRHPHVVIQNNIFNESKINTVVVCALTSNIKRASAPGNVLLKKGEGNLPKDSAVNISQIITVNKSDLVEKIGSLSPSKVKQIIEGVKLLIEQIEI